MPTPDPSPDAPVVLVVDDEPSLREVLSITLKRQGLAVELAANRRKALEAIASRAQPYPLIITDLVMPDGSGMDVLEAARARSMHSQVIVITAYSTVESALEAMRRGAYDFVTKPFSPQEIAELVHKALEKSQIVEENRRLRAQLATLTPPADKIFGDAPAMRRISTLVNKAATTKSTVLLTGESGTGKEHTARMLHQLSERADGPFCVINCGALPEALMESELFGHERGAFTGAQQATLGLFRQSDGGTLLLDEVGELPLSLQVKLLRVLQERKVRPVGSAVEVPIDVRLIAATNRDVEADVEAGRFRQDLYYRLNVIRVELPPLRERKEDVRRLARQMVRRFSDEFDKDIEGLSRDALAALERYDFPGNIRELENILERAVALSSGQVIEVDDLIDDVRGASAPPAIEAMELPEAGCDIDQVLASAERRLLLQALERTGGVRKEAARLVGITFRSFRYRLAKLGLDEKDDQEATDDDDDDAK